MCYFITQQHEVQTSLIYLNKMFCNGWTIFDTVHLFSQRCNSTSVSSFPSFFFVTQDCTDAQWVRKGMTCLTQEDSTSNKKKHLSTLWVCTRERNITVVNRGARVVTARPPNPRLTPHTPTNSLQFPSAGQTLHEHIYSLWLPAFCQPLSAERVSKHVPLPCGPAVNQRLKDA